MNIEIKVRGSENPTLVKKCLTSILEKTMLCSISTINSDMSPHINTAFFTFDPEYNLYILSQPSAKHSGNVERNPKASVTVFETKQEWGGPLIGIQLFGKMEITEDSELAAAQDLYGDRFPSYREWLNSLPDQERSSMDSRFYVFIPEEFKMLYDPEFGEEHYVEGTVIR